MSYKNPIVKFFGKQRPNTRVGVARVPVREEDRPTTGRINDEKRRHLEHILEKEKNRAKKERVMFALTHKLILKYGSKNAGIVTFFVEEFMNTHDDITPEDLNVLEKEINNAVNAKLQASLASLQDKSNGTDNGKNGTHNDNKGATMNRPPSGSEWQLIQAYQSIQGEEKERQDREAARRKKLKFKQDLDQHIEKAKTVDHLTTAFEDKDYARSVMADVEKYNQECKVKYDQIKKKNADELAIRRRQIEENQRRKEEEKAELKRIAEANLQFERDLMAKEQQKLLLQKQRQLENRKKVELEKLENDRRKREMKQQDADEDQKLMREYAAKLDRENAEREGAFRKKMQEMELYAGKFEKEGAGRIAREEREREEQLLLKEQRRKEQLDMENEQRKEEERRQRVQTAVLENKRQLERKKQLQDEEKTRDTALREQYKRDLDDYKLSEQEKLRKYRQSQEKYRTTLDAQVEHIHESQIKQERISTAERSLNMDTLREATQDPETLGKVLTRLHVSSRSNSPHKVRK